jgi:hypothetical protein
VTTVKRPAPPGTPDKAVRLVLTLRHGEPPTAPEMLPTSNVHFYCDDLAKTCEELRARGVEFPHPPVEQPRGSWSMFKDQEGNRFALTPRQPERDGAALSELASPGAAEFATARSPARAFAVALAAQNRAGVKKS